MTDIFEKADAEALKAEQDALEHAHKHVDIAIDGEEEDAATTVAKLETKRYLVATDAELKDAKPGEVKLRKLTKEEIWRGEFGPWASLADQVLLVLLDSTSDPHQVKSALYKLLGNYKFSNEDYDKLKKASLAIQASKLMKKRYHRIAKRNEIEQTAYGWAFFIIFLVYPSTTNRIFTTFTCYVVEEDKRSFLEADYDVSCTESLYLQHKFIAYILVLLIPVGIPVYFGRLIWKAKPDIKEHKGPHHLENLYEDYKPDCCMWEIYQMLQKVILVGLLTFIHRGSILQVLVGMVVAITVLILMVRSEPYLDVHTNILAVMGQTIIAMSYMSALLMRVDLEAESFGVDTVATVLIAANVPMLLYLAYDTWMKMQIEFYSVQVELLADEMGGVSAVYRALRDIPIYGKRDKAQIVRWTNWRGKHKFTAPPRPLIGTLRKGQLIKCRDQRISHKGVGKVLIDGDLVDGNDKKEFIWVQYNEVDGSGASIVAGVRNLQLLHHRKARRAGRLEVVVRRCPAPKPDDDTAEIPPDLLLVTVLSCKDLKNLDTAMLGKNDVYVEVTVNHQQFKRTETIPDAGSKCKWGSRAMPGQTLIFENISQIYEMDFRVYDEDDVEGDDGVVRKEGDLIGLCSLPPDAIKMDLHGLNTDRYDDDPDDPYMKRLKKNDGFGSSAEEEVVPRGQTKSVKQLVEEEITHAADHHHDRTEDEELNEMRAARKAAREQRLYDKVGRDKWGAGTWHWHSQPMLVLREDVDETTWEEDDLENGNAGDSLLAAPILGAFAARTAKRFADATVEKVESAEKKHHKHKHRKHRRKKWHGQAVHRLKSLSSSTSTGKDGDEKHDKDGIDEELTENPLANGNGETHEAPPPEEITHNPARESTEPSDMDVEAVGKSKSPSRKSKREKLKGKAAKLKRRGDASTDLAANGRRDKDIMDIAGGDGEEMFSENPLAAANGRVSPTLAADAGAEPAAATEHTEPEPEPELMEASDVDVESVGKSPSRKSKRDKLKGKATKLKRLASPATDLAAAGNGRRDMDIMDAELGEEMFSENPLAAANGRVSPALGDALQADADADADAGAEPADVGRREEMAPWTEAEASAAGTEEQDDV